MKPADQAQPWPAEMAVDRAIRAHRFLAGCGLLSQTQERKSWEALVRWSEAGGAALNAKLDAANRDDSARAMGTRPLDLLRRCWSVLTGRAS